MRIHTDNLTRIDIASAALTAGVWITDFEAHGSRKRDHAFEVKLSGSSPYRQNSGRRGAWGDEREHAARWDEWGVFLDVLFRAEPTLVTTYYDGREDFLRKTRSDADRARRYNREALAGRDYKAPWLTPRCEEV